MLFRAVRRLVPLALLLALAPAIAQPAQPIEDDGPFLVGRTDVVFQDAVFGQGQIRGRIYYPATAAGVEAPPDAGSGPFPLVAFQHGYLGRPSNYDDLCTHIASWGFVVASTGTETGFFPNQRQYARDTRSLLYYVEDQSDAPGPFSGMVDDGPWAASGHSMGGGVLALLIGIEERVQTIIGLQSAFVNDGRIGNINEYTGRHVQIAGSVDRIVPPSQVVRYFDEAESASRNVYFEVVGMGHSGPTDTVPDNEPLPAADQKRLHKRLVTGILRAEIKGEQNLYAEILGEGIAGEPVEIEAVTPDPVLWVRPSETAPALVVGAAARPDTDVVLAWSDTRAPRPTPVGEVGIDPAPEQILFRGPAGPEGTTEVLLPLADLAGADSVFVQGLALGAIGSVTRLDARAGASAAAPVAAARGDLATATGLGEVYPNPFRTDLTVRYDLADAGHARVEVYDVLGRSVAVLAAGEHAAGQHEAQWTGRDEAGRPVSAGLYVVHLRAGQVRLSQTIVRLP
ncbi:MAG: FlgD immunoglobulin-like domain containing protein [Bacteroidota bacterium]